MSNRRPFQFSLTTVFVALTTLCILLASSSTFIDVGVVLIGMTCTCLVLRHQEWMHHSTKVVLTVAAGAFLWLNARVCPLMADVGLDFGSDGPAEGFGPVGEYLYVRGWPLTPWMFAVFEHMRPQLGYGELWGILLIDVVVAVVSLLAIGFLVEWYVRKWKTAMNQTPNANRRGIQFCLRSLLIASMLVAGLLAAWRAYVEPYRRQRETMDYIEGLGGSYETELGPIWLFVLFRSDNFRNITEISLNSKEVSDADMAHLRELANLQTLDLRFTQVSDAGLAYLKGFQNLQTLDLWGTQVTDVGLIHLKGHTNLQQLWLHDTQVSDAGLKHLEALTNLNKVLLVGTQVTDKGVKKLQKALPNCKIYSAFKPPG